MHSDVWDPTQFTSIGGSWYFSTWLDDHSSELAIFFQRKKRDTITSYETHKAWMKVHCD